MHRALFGLSAILILSSWLLDHRGTDGLFFWSGVALTPLNQKGDSYCTTWPVRLLESGTRSFNSYIFEERRGNILRGELNPSWTPFCKRRPWAQLVSAGFPTEAKNHSQAMYFSSGGQRGGLPGECPLWGLVGVKSQEMLRLKGPCPLFSGEVAPTTCPAGKCHCLHICSQTHPA